MKKLQGLPNHHLNCFRPGGLHHNYVLFQVTDENQRAVLSTILYEVRFPLLDSIFFTNSVSPRELLSEQEVISLYQFFNGRAQTSGWKFNARKRRRLFIAQCFEVKCFVSMQPWVLKPLYPLTYCVLLYFEPALYGKRTKYVCHFLFLLTQIENHLIVSPSNYFFVI